MHGRVAAAVLTAADPIGVSVVIAGAFARDLHTHYQHGFAVERRTEDVDFALAVSDWPQFQTLRQALLATRQFQEAPGRLHRLQHHDGLPVDLVPFGGVEDESRHLTWPPPGDTRMHVFGFREALSGASTAILPGNVTVRFASIPALVLLKLIAWNDRHTYAPRRDAPDLLLLLRHYADLGNQNRLYTQFAHWLDEPDFDYVLAGARMAGHDVAKLLAATDRPMLLALLRREIDTNAPGRLPAEMVRSDPEFARRLLVAFYAGLGDATA
jgi:predicted nucleotidyltransferase